jgi:gliding motility-associated-like protein
MSPTGGTRKISLLTTFIFCALSVLATHNRAGEITYRHINGYTYEVTITTCTKSSVIADRQWLNINWGDVPEGQTLDSLERQSINFLASELDAQVNIYKGTHTYPGPGSYLISMLDPNRNNNIENIPVSVDVPFCIVSELIINPNTGHNNSVLLLNPPKERACLNKLWIHNPGAYDPDGDVLTYSLIHCRGHDCLFIPGYEYPDDATVEPDSFTIDPVTGDVIWEYPPMAGEFNIAILIEEWREVNGQLFKVGSVVRDMQITVINCDNDPPVIESILDTCVVIGNPLNIQVVASDPNPLDNLTYSAVGGPFQVEHAASFNSLSHVFFWNPDCEEVRNEPYYVHFKVEDDWAISLTDIETVAITVVAPPVENVFAEPAGNNMLITWNPHDCVANFDSFEYPFFSYKIYRHSGASGWEPSYCETGVPAYTGFELVGSVSGFESAQFLDEFGVGYGGYYCYRVVACWPDGAESIASEEICAELIKDVPVLTNVSVTSTNETTGTNYIAWSPPNELDTLNFSGPYHYELLWSPGYGLANQLIYTSSESPFLIWGDTIFDHISGINTQTLANSYRVNFLSDGAPVGVSPQASSVFISLIPNDNQITVVIDHQVPWFNESYRILMKGPGESDFTEVGISDIQEYTVDGLLNNTEYCFKVESVGTYNAEGILEVLLNFSQEVCGMPFDLTPPCPPELIVDADCIEIVDWVSWTNPNESCADDVTGYNLFFTPSPNGEFELLASFDPDTQTSYVYNADLALNSIAGCFYVTALDSILPGPDGLPNQNESEPSNVVCVDNCPIYFLPNVFSPNNDNLNDVFGPFPYKFIDSIDIQIFNRWGELIFESTDPEINWDGTATESGHIVSDGVYYYTIVVNTIRLEGIVPERFTGNIQVIDGQNPASE